MGRNRVTELRFTTTTGSNEMKIITSDGIERCSFCHGTWNEDGTIYNGGCCAQDIDAGTDGGRRKIMFFVNEYDSDGDIMEKGVYLHFGITRIKIAVNADELDMLETEIKKIITAIRDSYPEYRSKKKRILLIDDCRSKVDYDASHTARTFDKGLEMIREGSWDVIIFDHDLGDEDPAHTGYDLMCYLEQHPEHIPKDILICTSNSVGREKMLRLADKLLKR